MAIGISTSGNSENVLCGVRAARAKGPTTAAFTGARGGRQVSLVDHAIIVPSQTTARVQEMHLVLGHTLRGILGARMTGAAIQQHAHRAKHGTADVGDEIVAIGRSI